MKKIFQSIILASIAMQVGAQDLNTHYLYQMNEYNINAAYTGETEGIKAIINPGTQWIGMEGNPTNSAFGIHTAIKENAGIGAKVIVDQRGDFSNLTAEFSYAHKVQLSKDSKFSFGVTAGYFQSSLNNIHMINDVYTDITDPALSSSYYNESSFISGAGMLYSHKNIKVGVTAPHLIVSGRPMSNHMILSGHYKLQFNKKFVCEPIVRYQHFNSSPGIIDMGLRSLWDEVLWGQLTYRTNETMVVGAGFEVSGLQLGYMHTVGNNGLSATSSGSHELMIAFELKKGKGVKLIKRSKKPQTIVMSGDDEARKELNELKKTMEQLNSNSTYDATVTAEIDELIIELTKLLEKQEKGPLTIQDVHRIKEIKERVQELKKNLLK